MERIIPFDTLIEITAAYPWAFQVAVVDGSVIIKNESGEISLQKGEFAIAVSSTTLPVSAPMPEGFLDM